MAFIHRASGARGKQDLLVFQNRPPVQSGIVAAAASPSPLKRKYLFLQNILYCRVALAHSNISVVYRCESQREIT
jgi:hypothetical protein